MADRTVLVRLRANASDFNRTMVSARNSVRGLGDEIDTTNDRTAWLAQSILGLGPALIPLGAAGIPVVAGLATQMTIAGAAAGTAALAFNGVGDGLKALNDYQLDPSAQNMQKLVQAMDKIGPAGEEFVRFLDRVGPAFSQLGMTARGEMFPGVQDGITNFMVLLPQLNRIVAQVASGMGELASSGGAALAGDRFRPFFDYLEREAKPILIDMGETLGGFAEGFANLMVAFGPLTADFSAGFADMAQRFAEWSRNLDSNETFQSFLDYLNQAGPMALDFLGSLTDAFVGILHAAAPVGEVLLPAFATFLDIIAAIAQTPIGTAFVAIGAGVGLLGRSMALLSVTSGGVLGRVTALSVANARAAFSFNGLGAAARQAAVNMMTAGAASQRMAAGTSRFVGQARAIGGVAGQVALLGVVATGTADKVGLTNTAMGALMGSMAGPWGAAAGAVVGGFLDMRAAGQQVLDVMERLDDLDTRSGTDALRAGIDEARKQLTDLRNIDGVGDVFSTIFEDVGFSMAGRSRSGVIKELEGDVTRLGKALSDADAIAKGTKIQLPDGSVRSFNELTNATDRANFALRQYIAQYDIFTARLNKQQGMIAFRDSLRQLRDIAKDNPLGKAMGTDKQGDAVRGALLTSIQHVQKLGSEMRGLEHVRFMRQARRDILATAAQMGLPIGRVQRLLNDMGILDRTKAEPRVGEKGAVAAKERIRAMRDEIQRIRDRQAKIGEKGAAAAERKIRDLQRAINALRDREVVVTHTTRLRTLRMTGRAVGGVRMEADGGQVRAQYAGETRGPKDDTLVTLLSHREFVQPVASVDYYGEKMMEDIRLRRFPKPPGYAEGGSVGAAPRVSVSAPNVNVDGARVRVYVDGNEVRAIVVDELANDADMAGVRARRG